MVNAPVFLVGAVRSGTTMLRLMLDHHPSVTFPSEFEFVVPLVSDEGEWPALDDYYEFLSTHRAFKGFGVEVDKSLPYPELCRSFLEQKRAASGNSFYGSTVHNHFHRLRFIWPEARYIHLVRDPRDVANSCVAMGWGGNVSAAIAIWIRAEQLWQGMACELPEHRRITVRYEDILEDPRRELEKICAFVGVPYDDAMLRYPEDTTYSAPDYRFAYQWKRKMPEFEVRVAEARVAEAFAEDMIQAQGYALSGLPPLKFTPQLERRLKRQALRGRVKRRIERQGLRHFLEEYISRKLHIRPWHRKVRLRMNEIAAKKLK